MDYHVAIGDDVTERRDVVPLPGKETETVDGWLDG